MTVTSSRGASVNSPQRTDDASARVEDSTGEDTPVESPVESIVAQDVRVRKRVELGLSPRRPTAKAAPLRPPDSKTFPLPAALLPILLGIILIATLLLLVVNLSGGFPYAPQVERILAQSPVTAGILDRAPGPDSMTDGMDVATTSYRLHMGTDFSQADASFAQGEAADEWRIELVPEAAEYRMAIWPNRIAWSMLGIAPAGSYRFQASGEVDGETPGGYVGLVGRYQDEGNFYLFGVDGAGRFSVQMYQDGELLTLQEWQRVDYLNRAGSANVLTIEDDGATIRFFGNNMLLHEVNSAELPAGSVGLVGGAYGDDVAEVHFDWVQVYEMVTANP